MNLGWQRARGGQETVQLIPVSLDFLVLEQLLCAGLFISIAGKDVLEGQWCADPYKGLSSGYSNRQAGRSILNQRCQSR